MACLFSTLPDLGRSGPTITVKVSPSSALLKSLSDPEKIKEYSKQFQATMLIDTGASCSMIDTAIAPFLGLVKHGNEKITTPSGEKDCLTFDIDLMFMDYNFSIQNLRVVEGDFRAKQGIDGLIGRDILKNALLIYQGWANQYTLAF